MTFSIIGTGNIAWFLGHRLVGARHHCIGVYSRDVAAAGALGEALLADKHGAIADISDGEADICFMAVSDVAIGKVAVQLKLRTTVLAHTAGAVSIDMIKDAALERAVFWPVYSILKNNLPDHRNIPCGWEASSPKAERYVLEMGHGVTDILFEARQEQRKWLHLAAVMSNNFITHLLAVCERICQENNLPFSTLVPIIEQTFERIMQNSPQTLQTGPAVRRDSTTIQEHLALLSTHPNWQDVYASLTASIQKDNELKHG